MRAAGNGGQALTNLHRPTLTDRVAENIPRAGLQQLVAVVEEMKRRAVTGKRGIPAELPIKLHLDQKTGEVLEVEIPIRYGWI